MKTQILRGALIAIGVLIAPTMSAQFVSLSRCQAAYPCAFPFGLQYRPDPLIAGQYARLPDTAISVRLPLRAPLIPQLDKRPQPDLGAPAGRVPSPRGPAAALERKPFRGGDLKVPAAARLGSGGRGW